MRNYTIGIDLGINNVGWAEYDLNEKKVIDKGVNSFKASSSAQDRKTLRGTRRINKRRRHRVERLAILLNKIGFNTKRSYESELLEKRIIGLSQKLSEQEITNIIYYFSIHRGYIPYGDDKKDDSIYNRYQEDDFEYPCQYLKSFFDKNKKYRGISKLILLEDNLRELNKILKIQQNYYTVLSDNVIHEIIEIIKSKREYYEGPGAAKENQLSKYGRYRTIEDLKMVKNDPSYHKYLYEMIIGKCKLSMDEFGRMENVAPKWNYYAEEFNFLNDFINMSVKEPSNIDDQYRDKITLKGKFTKETILEFKEEILKSKIFSFEKALKKILGLTIDDIQGYRMNKNREPDVSSFEKYRYIKKLFEKKGLALDLLENVNNYNKIIYAMTVAPSAKEFEKIMFSRYKNINISDDELNIFKEIKIKNKKNNKLYHSISEKILKKAVNDMYYYNCEYNFMQLLKKKEYDKESKKYFRNNYSLKTKTPYSIEDKYIDEIIANPQVKKTLRKAIKIINAIIAKEKNYPQTIVIESAKELNGKDLRKQIEKEQKNFEALNIEATNILMENGYSITDKNIEKIINWKETNETCIYCNKPISISQVLSTEVEHILPISQSMDNSSNNKTCSCLKCNSEKSKQTPYEYLKNAYPEFKNRVLNNYPNIPQSKKENLLFEGSIDKYSLKFINRNLRDTAFASRALVEELNKYNEYLSYKIGYKINVVTSPGQLTSKIRRCIKVDTKKDRDYLYHHVIDAMILASIADSKIGKILIKSQQDPKYWLENNKKEHKDEVVDMIENSYIYLNNKEQIFEFNRQCKEMPDNNKDGLIKVSFEVKKNNIKQFSDTNYRKYIIKENEYYIINKIADIYSLLINKANGEPDKDKKLLDELFDTNKKSKMLLCEEKDSKLFNKLKEIYYKNSSSINPFVDECIYKYGLDSKEKIDFNLYGIKKNENLNSSIVKSLRYLETKTNPYLKKGIYNKRNNRYNEFTINNKKEHTYVGLDNIAQVCTRIFYSKAKGKFVFLPISAISFNNKNHKFNPEDHYYKETYQRIIGNEEVIFINDVYCGEWIKIYKKNGEVIEGRFSSFDKTNNYIGINENGNMIKKSKTSFRTTDKGIVIYTTDILGNRYVRVDSRRLI